MIRIVLISSCHIDGSRVRIRVINFGGGKNAWNVKSMGDPFDIVNDTACARAVEAKQNTISFTIKSISISIDSRKIDVKPIDRLSDTFSVVQ